MAATFVEQDPNASGKQALFTLGETGLKIFRCIAFFLLCVRSISPQRNFQPAAPYPPQLSNELKQLQQSALTSDYAWTQLTHLANNIGPRPAGSNRGKMVLDFAFMRRSGCDFNYHHTAADTLDKVVPRELQENAAVMAVLAHTLANLPGSLERPAPKSAPAD